MDKSQGASHVARVNSRTSDIQPDKHLSSVTTRCSMADSNACEWLYPPMGNVWLLS
jgi:hypothetical protein